MTNLTNFLKKLSESVIVTGMGTVVKAVNAALLLVSTFITGEAGREATMSLKLDRDGIEYGVLYIQGLTEEVVDHVLVFLEYLRNENVKAMETFYITHNEKFLTIRKGFKRANLTKSWEFETLKVSKLIRETFIGQGGDRISVFTDKDMIIHVKAYSANDAKGLVESIREFLETSLETQIPRAMMEISETEAPKGEKKVEGTDSYELQINLEGLAPMVHLYKVTFSEEHNDMYLYAPKYGKNDLGGAWKELMAWMKVNIAYNAGQVRSLVNFKDYVEEEEKLIQEAFNKKMKEVGGFYDEETKKALNHQMLVGLRQRMEKDSNVLAQVMDRTSFRGQAMVLQDDYRETEELTE